MQHVEGWGKEEDTVPEVGDPQARGAGGGGEGGAQKGGSCSQSLTFNAMNTQLVCSLMTATPVLCKPSPPPPRPRLCLHDKLLNRSAAAAS